MLEKIPFNNENLCGFEYTEEYFIPYFNSMVFTNKANQTQQKIALKIYTTKWDCTEVCTL